MPSTTAAPTPAHNVWPPPAGHINCLHGQPHAQQYAARAQCLTYAHFCAAAMFADTPLNPPDPIFNLNTQFKADQCPQKVNVGVGAYRTNEGKPWVLPVVKKAELLIVNDAGLDHEYLPIDGLAEFTEASARLVLGKDAPAILDNRVPRPRTPLLPAHLCSTAPCRPSPGRDPCAWALRSLRASRPAASCTWPTPPGATTGPSSTTAAWRSASTPTTTRPPMALTLPAGSPPSMYPAARTCPLTLACLGCPGTIRLCAARVRTQPHRH